ncbi:general stress protein 26 [Tahibacter aquaticus]|uniref:General stress protein 26 n=1 Tax=Tahibacter aquaticus TaxID=520092 RepID=A0A4R6Z0I2_9GAMM|nr:pyridoxamine 5'-phosphate oxidase family protein [Tahibacter aquaticus]TDR45033.1 general stress protein 26 [Tahibacter aquaticus]
MANEENTGKIAAELTERAWEIAGSLRTSLLTTYDGTQPRIRPMAGAVRREEHAIYFMTESTSPKITQLERHPIATAAFADDSGNKFVTFTGTAVVSNDREKIREIWTPFAKAWWDSPDDPIIRLITLHPTEAELWDSPGKLLATVIMLSAVVTGAKPKVGEHAKLYSP